MLMHRRLCDASTEHGNAMLEVWDAYLSILLYLKIVVMLGDCAKCSCDCVERMLANGDDPRAQPFDDE